MLYCMRTFRHLDKDKSIMYIMYDREFTKTMFDLKIIEISIIQKLSKII